MCVQWKIMGGSIRFIVGFYWCHEAFGQFWGWRGHSIQQPWPRWSLKVDKHNVCIVGASFGSNGGVQGVVFGLIVGLLWGLPCFGWFWVWQPTPGYNSTGLETGQKWTHVTWFVVLRLPFGPMEESLWLVGFTFVFLWQQPCFGPFLAVVVTTTIQQHWAGRSSKVDMFGLVCVF